MKTESKISIPVIIEYQFIQDLLNEQFAEIIYKDENEDHINILAKKYSTIIFTHDNQKVNLIIPLDLQISKKTILINLKSEAKLKIHLSIQYHIRNDWKIQVETAIDEYFWEESPSLGIGELQFSVKKLGDYILNRSQNLISNTINDALTKKLNLKDLLESGWKKLSKPLLVDKDRSIWLFVKPEHTSFYQIINNSVEIKTGLIMQGAFQISIGKEPSFINKNSLPDFLWSESQITNEGLNLFCPIQITPKFLNRIAKDQLIGKTFEKNGLSVNIEGVDLHFDGNFLVGNIQFSGSTSGTISIKGVPKIDTTNQKLFFEHLDYDIQANGFLLGLATRLFKKKIASIIASSSILDLNKLIALILELINGFLPKTIQEKIELNGAVTQLIIEKIDINNDVLILDINLLGDANICVYATSIRDAVME